MSIRATFWGTRGSMPRPESGARIIDRIRAALNAAEPGDIATPEAVDAFIRGGCAGALPTIHGGNTACVQVSDEGGPSLLIDLGTGARDCAAHVARTAGPAAAEPWHVLISHLHWDHIMGFPSFPPAYVAGTEINIYSCHPNAEEVFRHQHGAPSFPVPFDALPAEIRFHTITPDEAIAINGFRVTPHELDHPGRSFGFRVERAGAAVVYASDAEHEPEGVAADDPYVGWIRGADLLIFDAQFSLDEAEGARKGWGHSANVVGVELALLGGVRRLVLFHHDPLADDARIECLVAEAREHAAALRRGPSSLDITAARDGLVIAL